MTRQTKQASGVEGVELSGPGVCTVEGECHLSAREQQPWPLAGVSIFNNSSGTEWSLEQRAEGRVGNVTASGSEFRPAPESWR